MSNRTHLALLAAGSFLSFGLSQVAANEADFVSEPTIILADQAERPLFAPVRTASTERSNLGGGFIEFLFGDRQSQGGRNPRMLVMPWEPQQQGMNSPYGSQYPGEPAHPEFDPRYEKRIVEYHGKESPGTIVVDTPNTYLYLVLGGGKALRYGIGVGREGFTWTGGERISRMKEWPDWFPPAEMIGRQPYLPRVMAGGPGNPLGARALYLGSTLYRIHGTNQPSTIGQFVSSGCIRLLNEDIEDLYSRVQVGTRVVVLPGKPPETVASAPAPIVAGSASGVTQIAPSNNNPPAITSSQLPPVR